MIVEHGNVTTVHCDLCERMPSIFLNRRPEEVFALLLSGGWYADGDIQACPRCHRECEGSYDYETVIDIPCVRAKLNGHHRGDK